MLGTIIIVMVIWIVTTILFFPFFKNYILEKQCKPGSGDCDGCGDIGKCHAAMGLMSFIIVPFLPFIILWWFALKPLSTVLVYCVKRLHTWEMSLAKSMTDAAEEKKGKRKEEKDTKETETIKSLKKKNKELVAKVAELNKYNREDMLDLEE